MPKVLNTTRVLFTNLDGGSMCEGVVKFWEVPRPPTQTEKGQSLADATVKEEFWPAKNRNLRVHPLPFRRR
jgi:hypothetical protein